MLDRFGLRCLSLAAVSALAFPCHAGAADNLTLREGISFNQDTNNGFPIVGERMEDATLDPGRPALVFFGASGDLNTNRQAKRLVQLYKKHRDTVKFIVIDVDRPASEEAKDMVKKHYPGYVPAQLLLDGEGRQMWSQVGEVEKGQLQAHLEKLVM